MGFRLPAKVHFDQMVLSDEATEKSLLIQLVDRNIISSETVIERFGEIPEIEKIRIRREEKDRKVETMPQKASPYHNPQHKNDVEKIALQKGDIAVEDLGIIPSEDTGLHPFTDPKDRRSREERDAMVEKELEEQKTAEPQKQEKEFDPKGRPEDGRPKNAIDQGPRKQRVEKPKGFNSSDFVNISLWATEAQNKISEIINPAILSHYDKKSLRSLTKAQANNLEHFKLSVLCSLEPFQEVNHSLLKSIVDEKISIDSSVAQSLNKMKEDFFERKERQPNIDELRQMHVSCYALSKTS